MWIERLLPCTSDDASGIDAAKGILSEGIERPGRLVAVKVLGERRVTLINLDAAVLAKSGLDCVARPATITSIT